VPRLRCSYMIAAEMLTFGAAFRLGLLRRHGDAWKPRAFWRTPRRSNRWDTTEAEGRMMTFCAVIQA
jgi:hypothetical protein